MTAVRDELLEDGKVLHLVLEGEKGNVLTRAALGRLDEALGRHSGSPRLRLVMLQGAGRHFSFGASVEEHQPDQAPAMLADFHRLVRRMVRFPVPLLSVVSGRCLGGAFELVLASHFVIAAKDATFGCPEIKLGVFPPVLAALGPERLGRGWTDRLVLTGEELGAVEAHQSGLVTELAPAGVTPLEHALAWYRRRLAPLSAFSLRAAVEAVRLGAGSEARVEEALGGIEQLYLTRLLPSHDGNEGIHAFLAKRPPVWRDS